MIQYSEENVKTTPESRIKMNTNCVVFSSPCRTTGVAHPFNTGSGWEGIAISIHSVGSLVGVYFTQLDIMTY